MTEPESQSPRAVLAALAANLGIAVAKLAAFAITGATSMLAEGIHSLADTGNQGLLLLGRRRARRGPTAAHPFGHGPEAYFAAFLVAVILFTLGSAFSLAEGVEKLRRPHEVESPGWAVGVLLVAAVLEGLSLRTALGETRSERRGGSYRRFVRDTRNAEGVVVLLEDSAALVGLGFALVGIVLALVTGETRWDALGTVAIGLLLGVVALVLAREMRSLLVGESARPEDLAAIHDALDGDDAVTRVVDLRTMHLGPDELLVAARVELRAGTGDAAGDVIDALARRVRAAVPIARQVWIEPEPDGGS